MKLEAVIKLFRLKPTMAWSMCGILLGIALAINQVGLDLNWTLLSYLFIGTIIIQGFIAHALNDLIDEEVDKQTDIKGTGRTKILIDRLITRKELALFAVLCMLITVFIAITLYYKLGYFILIYYSIGILAAVLYSVSPFKLGWKPFAEWTIVFPVLVTLVFATYFIATGSIIISSRVIIISIIFALININWFIVSRMMDYIPDLNNGKNTTIVWLGLGKGYNYFCVITVLTVLVFLISIFNFIWVVISLIYYLLSIIDFKFDYLDYRYNIFVGKLRTKMIIWSIISFIYIAVMLIFDRYI